MYHISLQATPILPRERLIANGANSLTDQELLSILIRTGNKSENVFQLSSRILSHFSSLAELRTLSLQELQAIPGIGLIKAIELQAMMELGYRIQQAELPCYSQIDSPHELAQKMRIEIGDKKQEHLIALYLNTQNELLHRQTIFIGSVNRSMAEPREILHYAIKHLASSIIIVHNHPSGSCQPSQGDIQATKQIKKACHTMQIKLLDHLIVTQKAYYSFREKTDLL